MSTNGQRFGFTFPIYNDPNHAQQDGRTATASLGSTPLDNDPGAPVAPPLPKGTPMDTTYHATGPGGIAGSFFRISTEFVHVIRVDGADPTGARTLQLAQVIAARTNTAIVYAQDGDYPADNGARKNGAPLDESNENLHIGILSMGAPPDVLEMLVTGNVVDSAGNRLDTWYTSQSYIRNAKGQIELVAPGGVDQAALEAAVAAAVAKIPAVSGPSLADIQQAAEQAAESAVRAVLGSLDGK